MSTDFAASFYFYFVRSGWANLSNGKLKEVGVRGFDWSSRASLSDTTYANRLYFNASDVNPSPYGDRYIGFPLRCLAS